METFFMWVGIICSLLLCFAIANFSHGYYVGKRERSYYKGIRRQIKEVVTDLQDHFEDETIRMKIRDVKNLLVNLHDRRTPNIMQLSHKIKDENFSIIDEMYDRRIKGNYPLGTKVIIRSNEPGPLLIGTVHEYCNYGKSNRVDSLAIKDEKTGEIFVTLNTEPLFYDDDLLNALNKLEWWEQWNIVAGGKCSMSKEDAQRKENYNLEMKGI